MRCDRQEIRGLPNPHSASISAITVVPRATAQSSRARVRAHSAMMLLSRRHSCFARALSASLDVSRRLGAAHPARRELRGPRVARVGNLDSARTRRSKSETMTQKSDVTLLTWCGSHPDDGAHRGSHRSLCHLKGCS
jgi:hypothetical protein